MSPRRHPATAPSGFTLVELLAALAVGAVVLAAIAALIRNVGLSFERGTRGVSDAERVLLAVDRLAADFASARFIARQDDPATAAATLFSGQPDSVAFVTAGHVAAGTREDEFVFLSVERSGATSRLVRRRAPFVGAGAPLAGVTPRDPVVMLEGQLELRFAYATGATPPKWVDRWVNEAQLPRQVRLVAGERAGNAGVLSGAVFTIRADAPASCAQAAGVGACFPSAQTGTQAPASPAAPARTP